VQLYPRLFRLPGGLQPNGQLRAVVAEMLQGYPESLSDPMRCLRRFLDEEHLALYRPYVGDLETDFLRFLGET
jgi:hypothetical protein